MPIVSYYLWTSLSVWTSRCLKINISVFYPKCVSRDLILCLLCSLYHTLFPNSMSCFSHYHIFLYSPFNQSGTKKFPFFFTSMYDKTLSALLTISIYCLKFLYINILMTRVYLPFIITSYVTIISYQYLIGISAQPPCSECRL